MISAKKLNRLKGALLDLFSNKEHLYLAILEKENNLYKVYCMFKDSTGKETKREIKTFPTYSDASNFIDANIEKNKVNINVPVFSGGDELCP